MGCDTADDDGDALGVLGRWVNTNEDEFLNISNDEIVVHFFVENEPDSDDCCERDVVEVVEIDGDEWTVQSDDGDDPGAQTIRMVRDGDDLVITFDLGESENSERYERSTQTDFTPLCTI